jgi:hypothetical protein
MWLRIGTSGELMWTRWWTFGSRLERELQMMQLSDIRCNCIAILWVSLVSFAAIALCVTFQRVFTVVCVCFVIDSVRKLLDIPSYISADVYVYNQSVDWLRITLDGQYVRIYVRRFPCPRSMARPRVADIEREGLQIWRVAVKLLNKQSWTADKGWSSSFGGGRGANNHSP